MTSESFVGASIHHFVVEWHFRRVNVVFCTHKTFHRMNCNSRHSLTFQVIHHQVNIWISHILYAGLQVKDGELARYVCERYQRWHRHCELFKSSNLKCLCQNVVSGTSMIPDTFYVSNLITRGRMQCKTTAYKMLKHFQSYCVFWTFESIVENNQPTQPTNQKQSRAESIEGNFITRSNC